MNSEQLKKQLLGLTLAGVLLLFFALPSSFAKSTFSSLSYETKASIKLYISILGTKTNSNNLVVSESFLESLDNVVVMGNVGTIEHGYTDLSTGIIDIMDWSSNECFSDAQFEMFVLMMNEYFGTAGIIHSYTGFSEKTYVWNDVDQCDKVICWLKNQTVVLRWYYEENKAINTAKPTSTPTTKPALSPESTHSKSKTICSVEGCTKEATKSIVGIFGTIEYYCSKHHEETIQILNSFGR